MPGTAVLRDWFNIPGCFDLYESPVSREHAFVIAAGGGKRENCPTTLRCFHPEVTGVAPDSFFGHSNL